MPSIGGALPDPLPPLPPPPVERVLVEVSGNGTVTNAAPLRTLAGVKAVKRIKCGVGGWDCYGEYRPGEALALTAKPATGYAFKNWTGACSGSASTCRIVASDARTVTAVFAPTSTGAAVAAKLREPRLDVRWARSIGNGTLVIGGSTSRPARARIDMRRPGGGPLATLKLDLSGGSFRKKLSLRSGALAGGAKLFPGGFTVALTGRAGALKLPLQVQTIAVRAPKDGVVRQAFRSRKAEGSSVRRFAAGTTEVWANFRFETQPAAGLPLKVRWFFPDGRVIGDVQKNNRPVVSSYMRLPTGLARGLWKAELRVGTRVVQTLSVPID